MSNLNNPETFLPLVALLCLIFIFVILIRTRDKLLDIEKTLVARYKTTMCKVYIGVALPIARVRSYPWIFTRLSIYENFLVIKSTKFLVINFSEINYFRFPPAMFMRTGVQINYRQKDGDKTIVIYVLNPGPLKRAVEGKVKIIQ